MSDQPRKTGTYEILGSLKSFVPYPLPPSNPPLELSPEILELYGQAMFHIGKLNEMAHRLPNSTRFLKAYVIKEAMLSSAIEGIHTTLVDIFATQQLDQKPDKNTQLVLNYTYALEAALDLLQKKGLPISTRVLLQAHATLMSGGSEEKANPGHFRTQAVRVGNLIPAPAPKIPALMSDLETFINIDDSLPPLIKAGLAHVQFETIHPFLDGNGRIGRLLIVLMLIESNLLHTPVLYPSYYFKKHQMEYYKRLDTVRTEGDFEGWILYYLLTIEKSAHDAWQRANDIDVLHTTSITQLQQAIKSQKQYELALRAFEIFYIHPVISIAQLAELLDKSYNTAATVINFFIELGILTEIEERKRNKIFAFSAYLNALEKEY